MLMGKNMEIYMHTCWKKISGKCAFFFSFTMENHLTFILYSLWCIKQVLGKSYVVVTVLLGSMDCGTQIH